MGFGPCPRASPHATATAKAIAPTQRPRSWTGSSPCRPHPRRRPRTNARPGRRSFSVCWSRSECERKCLAPVACASGRAVLDAGVVGHGGAANSLANIPHTAHRCFVRPFFQDGSAGMRPPPPQGRRRSFKPPSNACSDETRADARATQDRGSVCSAPQFAAAPAAPRPVGARCPAGSVGETQCGARRRTMFDEVSVVARFPRQRSFFSRAPLTGGVRALCSRDTASFAWYSSGE
mmetsp:Transcript_44069/g.128300  ORF Transcript_44069/g.128300 Transcript_44069/m.128300 type:complete len:235 (-) Transcript_44069:11-715(-)